MANGQRAAPAVPLSPCLIHEKGVREGVADRRDAPGHTSRQKHTLPTAAQPLTALRLRKFIVALCKKRRGKGYFLFLYAICRDDRDCRPWGCDGLLGWNPQHNPAPTEQIFNCESSKSISIHVVYIAGKYTYDTKTISYLVSIMKYCVLIDVVRNYVSLLLQQISGIAIWIVLNLFFESLLGCLCGGKAMMHEGNWSPGGD